MTDLATWLLGCIIEDEAVVKSESRWLDPGSELLTQFGDFGDSERFMVEIGASRVLAECEAKRRIVEAHDLNEERLDIECGEVEHNWPCLTLKLLALPYADRPGYREEWRP